MIRRESGKHVHHILPKHLGGDDSEDNLTPPISIELHAALHEDLYNHFGNVANFVAWKVLLGRSERPYEITPELREAICRARAGSGNPMFGKVHSESTRQKISEALKKRKPFTIEHLKHLSEATKGVPRGPFTEEHKRNISIAKMGKPLLKNVWHVVSDKTRAAIGVSRKGKKASPETIAKMIASRTGLKRSPETRKHMSDLYQERKRKKEQESGS